MFEIYKYKEEDKGDWDTFVEQSNNGTIFHLQQFLAYHGEKYRRTKHSLIFKDNGNIISVLPAELLPRYLSPTCDMRTFISPYGASYGGFVIPNKFTLHQAYELIGCFMNYAKEQYIDNVQITMPPLVYYKNPNEYLDYALLKHGFMYEPKELTYAVPATRDPFTLFNKKARNATRKAVKSCVKTRESHDFKTFYKILVKNMEEKHVATPTHTLDELLWLDKHLPGKLRLFMAFLENEPIAGIMAFVNNQVLLSTFYIAHYQEYQEYRPVNLLLHDIIKFAYIKGYRYLGLGTTARLNEDDDWNKYLLKESVGAVGYFRKKYTWTE